MTERTGYQDLRATRRVGDPEPTELAPLAPEPEPLPPPLAATTERPAGWLVGGRYRLERQLNSGGMGTVHLAQPIGGNQKVVVKFPHAHLVTSQGFRERFAHEIQALQKLTHPHVVEIYDAGTELVREDDLEREVPYLVVRYMSGGSLKDRIAQAGGRLDPTQLEWLRPIADALDFIHSQNVVHRDVKPENLLFDVHGTVYLTDFGIAKLTGSDSELAVEGILGSPSYMAPEYTRRAQGTESDQYKLDQYSLAVVVYEALCGALPHSGDSVPVLLTNKQTRPAASIAERLPDLPKSLADAIMRGLACDPGERFDSCGEFADAVLAAARPRGRRRRWPLVVLASIALGAACTYAYLEIRPRPSPTMQIASLRERVREIDTRGQTARTRLARLQREVDTTALLTRQLGASAGPPHAGYGVSIDATSLQEVDRRLRAIEAALAKTAEERRALDSLRDRSAPLEESIDTARRAVDEQRAEARARADRLFELRLQVAELQDRAGARTPDPRIAGLGRDGATLEERTTSDAAVLDGIETALDASSADVAALVARIDRDERSIDDQRSRLEQARSALKALRTRLGPPVPPPPPVGSAPEASASGTGARARAARKLVTIPAGAFVFGCDPEATGDCDPAQGPAQSVSLPSFAIDRSEVSVAEYRECVRAEVCTPPQGLDGSECNGDRTDREDHPINCVRFDQARTYCDWVGKTLPTDEQWEKAARGDTGAPFPWGSDAPDCERAVHSACAKSTAAIESGSAERNANRLHHMAGNVWEWTRTPDTKVRQIVRGGSFRSNAKGLRSDRRISTGRTSSPDGAGFRCAKDG